MICNIVTFVNSCHIEVYRNDIPSAEPRTPKKKEGNKYNFTTTICHYDYKIVNLRYTIKFLSLFSLFNMAGFGHFVSL